MPDGSPIGGAAGDAAGTAEHSSSPPTEDGSSDGSERSGGSHAFDKPFGAPGRPLSRSSPFVVGFFAAAGVLLAYWLFTLVLAIGSVLILVVVSIFLAVGLNPAVEWLMHRGLTRAWAVVAVVLAVVLAIAVFLFALVPVITDQLRSIADSAPGWLDGLQHNKTIDDLDQKYDVIAKLKDYIVSGDLAQRVFGGVVGVGLAVLGFLANAFVVVVMTLYFLASLPRTKRAAYRLAPASRRERVTRLGDQILAGIGAYVSGAFVVALCAGLSTLIVLFVVGLGKYALALALVVALLDVIPMIGATLGAVVVSLIGLGAGDLTTFVVLVIFYVAYQQVENYLIYPRVMSRAVDIPGLLTVIAALVGASLLGVIGALMAIPTAAALVLLIKEVVYRRQDER